MILTLFRHGEAADASSDRQRALTNTGEDDVSFGCHQYRDACLARDLPEPQLILHSPWLRASQTAEIIAAVFTRAGLQVHAALQPGGAIASVDAALVEAGAANKSQDHIILVGHQPQVSRLVDYYLGEPGRVPPLAPGGLAALSLGLPAASCASLLFWAMPPEYEAGL